MSQHERTEPPVSGAPWQAAAVAGLAVLAVAVAVFALGGSAAVALVLAATAFALATVIPMGWPERFGGRPRTPRG